MMRDKRILYVMLLFTVFMFSVGFTYAYFALDSNLENDTNKIETTLGTLAIEYSDGTQISAYDIEPGWTQTKTIKIKNNGTLSIYFKIIWEDLINEITNNELVMSATCVSKLNGVETGTCEGITTTAISSEIFKNQIFIDVGYEYTYTIKFDFIETSSAQNYNQAKTFSGTIKIAEDQSPWYNKCSVGSPNLNCKVIADSTAFADNTSSTYVVGGSGIDFSAVSSDTNGKGLYYTVDKSKTEGGERVYYYRGTVTNNYLIFGGYCFRVIRTTEDGSIRLRYDGVPNAGSCPQTGSDVSITDAPYNKSFNDNAYAGYMYGTSSSGTYAATHTNTTDSNIKKVLDAWYTGGTTSGTECYSGGSYVNCDFSALTTKLTNYSTSIADTPYCNDRSIGTSGTVGGTVFTSLGYAQNNTLFGSIRRIGTSGPAGTSFTSANASPSFKCAQNNDKFTLKVANGGTNGYGNNALNYPIGLLTSDEAVYAGHPYWVSNSNGYLYTSKAYWLMNPSRMENNDMYGFLLTGGGDVYNYRVDFIYSVLPVISLKSNAEVSSGNGTYNSPYVIN